MSASFRIFRERGAFELSAICIGDVVPVRARGRLSTCTKTPQNKVHAPALFASVPFLPLPPARPLAARSRHPVESLSRPFSSVVVIGNTLRRLASVLLLRLSQFPRSGHGPNEFLGAFLKAPRSLTRPRFQLRQKSLRGPLDSFEVLSLSIAHGINHRAGVRQGVAKDPQELVKHGQGHD